MNVIAICLPLLLLSPLATLQEGERPTFTPPKAAGTPSAGAASALKPGVLPKDATPKAVELWKRACAAALAPGAERTRVEGFQLSFGHPDPQQRGAPEATRRGPSSCTSTPSATSARRSRPGASTSWAPRVRS